MSFPIKLWLWLKRSRSIKIYLRFNGHQKEPFASPGGYPAGCPMPAVKPVLQIDLGLSDQVVRAQEVPVQNLDSEDRVLREGGLELEALAEYWVESGLATN